jgi:hypothetical protein
MKRRNYEIREELLANNTSLLCTLKGIAEAQAIQVDATRKLRLVIGILVLLSVCLTIELGQAFKPHGPSQFEKMQLEQLIDG